MRAAFSGLALHHREPGVFGLLGLAAPVSGEEEEDDKTCKRPYYGVIADGIHLHPLSVSLAYNLHSKGFILVTDAMHLAGMPDGKYEWVNGEKKEWIEKRGSKLCIAEPPLPSSSPSLPPSPPSSPPQSSLLKGKQNGHHVNGYVNGGPGRSQGEEATTAQNGNGVKNQKKYGTGGTKVVFSDNRGNIRTGGKTSCQAVGLVVLKPYKSITKV